MPANSTPTQDKRICIYGHRLAMRISDPNHLTIEVRVLHGAVLDRPGWKRSPMFEQIILPQWSQHPRHAFLSSNGEEQRKILSTIIRGVQTPFPLQHIHWAHNDFPQDSNAAHTLDEIIARRLTHVAHLCAQEHPPTTMLIKIIQMEKVSESEYDYLRLLKEPLGDWIRENPEIKARMLEEPLGDWIQENPEINEASKCLRAIFNLQQSKNRYFGVSSVKMGEEAGEMECSICMGGFVEGKQEIRIPCSHIFHGFCILSWLENAATCPLCRFSLLTN